MHRWVVFAATGAELAWRVKNGARSLPAKTVEVLPDGSTRVRLRESDSMLARRRRQAGDATLPRLPDTLARLVEFDLLVTDERGRTRVSRFRILTTLLDHRAHPARQIAAVYAERWQVDPDEISFVAVLRLTRAHLGTNIRCQQCGTPSNNGDPVEALVSAIAAHPRNRTGRQRTSPRTARQRRTERTRDVTYTINVVPSNLPKAA